MHRQHVREGIPGRFSNSRLMCSALPLKTHKFTINGDQVIPCKICVWEQFLGEVKTKRNLMFFHAISELQECQKRKK